jgi:hypothetical protein
MTDLITVAEYNDAKNITSGNLDLRLAEYIPYVSKLVENYCNRTFLDYYGSPGVTEWYDAKTNLVTLLHFPVVQVNSVYISVDGGKTQTLIEEDESDYEGYYVDLVNGQVRTQIDTYYFLTYYNTSYRSLEINYNAGYAATPDDLKLAVINLCEFYIGEDYTPTKAALGTTLENPFPSISFPAHIRRVFDLYRVPF